MRDRSENFFKNDIYPVKKYVLQISVGYKKKRGQFYGRDADKRKADRI